MLEIYKIRFLVCSIQLEVPGGRIFWYIEKEAYILFGILLATD